MAPLVWDQVGERTYETGVDRGVLYTPDAGGVYTAGVAWNGLTTVTESPSGAEASPQYADNIKYLNLIGAETLGLTIEAFTYPDEFAVMDGSVSPEAGVVIGQQNRGVFGLCYRTRIGDDISGTGAGYKLHLVYGCQASPSERAYGTINDSPEAIAFSWDIATTPVPVTGHAPSSLVVVDSTKADVTALEDALYGGGTETVARLPMPDEVLTLVSPLP